MGKKSEKREKPLKTVEERREIAERARAAIAEHGLNAELLPSLADFFKILDDYCMEGLTSGFSGRLYLPEIGRHLAYILPCRKSTLDAVWLEAPSKTTATSAAALSLR